MPRFMYIYRGALPSLTPEQGAERAEAFGAWMKKADAALVDVGSPFGLRTSMRDDGADVDAGDLTGYSIVEAEDLTEARALTEGLPFLSGGDGKCAVEIFELLQM